MENLQDPSFSLNNFRNPKILSVTDSYIRNLLLLLLGKPGFYPSIPTLGMNIQKYLYNFIDDIDTNMIKSELVSQCHEFLPEVQSGEFDVYMTVLQERPVLVFLLPMVIDNKTLSVALGVTTNNKGELVYKYTTNASDIEQEI